MLARPCPVNGRSLHGERGLKLFQEKISLVILRRSLHGERGLKLYDEIIVNVIRSLPSRGAWIETLPTAPPRPAPSRSLHGERGLKHVRFMALGLRHAVAPFTGSVD